MWLPGGGRPHRAAPTQNDGPTHSFGIDTLVGCAPRTNKSGAQVHPTTLSAKGDSTLCAVLRMKLTVTEIACGHNTAFLIVPHDACRTKRTLAHYKPRGSLSSLC